MSSEQQTRVGQAVLYRPAAKKLVTAVVKKVTPKFVTIEVVNRQGETTERLVRHDEVTPL
jgi:hypothetical protein